MAGTLQQQLASINAKATVLVERYLRLAAAHERDLATIAELEASLARSKAREAELESEVTMLRNSSVIAPRSEDVVRARALISELVREIDKCISDLSN